MKKKTVALLLALTLVVGGVIGGTVAYLTTSTNKVTNTFTVGDINITLTETKAPDGSSLGNEVWSAKLIPGNSYAKDPVVTVLGNSEDCWLFVKVTNDAADYLDYTSNLTKNTEGWTAYTKDGVAGVYYREVSASADNQVFHLINGDKVTVKTELAKQGTAGAALTMPTNDVTLTYKAAAVQKANIGGVDAAYAQVASLLG